MARIYFCGKRIVGGFHTYYKVEFDDGRTTQYLRAGPSDPSTSGGPFNLSGMPTMGYLHVESGDYVLNTKDFDDTGKNHFNELVYSGSDDVVSQKWDEMLQVAAEIEDARYTYTALGQNCNTFTGVVARAVGLDFQIPDWARFEVNEPGGNYDGGNKKEIDGIPGFDKPLTDHYREYPTDVSGRIKSKFKKAEKTSCPIILDLDGNGVVTTSVESGGVYFDHDGNGFAEQTGWVSKGDGLLVWDRNGNGVIDDGSELFGNHTVLNNGNKARNGFEALYELDSNHDGVIDLNDPIFSSLRIWKDSNQDGVTQQGELFTLDEIGIANIKVPYTVSDYIDANGNAHKQQGGFTWADGRVGKASDVWFQVDRMSTLDKTDVDISEEINKLPQIIAMGNVHNLREAMALDTSGNLKALVAQYASEMDMQKRETLLDDIIFAWTGADKKASYHYLMDGRIIYALEAFVGRKYNEEQGGFLIGQATPFLRDAYTDLKNYIRGSLMLQTHVKTYADLITFSFDDGHISGIDITKLAAQIRANDALNGGKELPVLQSLIDSVRFGIPNQDLSQLILSAMNIAGSNSGDGVDKLFYFAGRNTLVGGSSNDTLQGALENDVLLGGAGNDSLNGGGGDDWLEGGVGNDYLYGGAGNDTYYFEAGWGIDTLRDNGLEGDKDVIRFGAGIRPEDIRLTRDSGVYGITYLVISNQATNDSIWLEYYFDDLGVRKGYGISEIQFADGTVWSGEQVKQMVQKPTEGNDKIWGYEGDWEFHAGGGNDYVKGASGKNILYGDAGNDTLYGQDMDDQLFGGVGDDDLRGYGGNDRLYGGIGNDWLDGGDGDDWLEGGAGNDNLNGGSGSDRLYGGEGIDSLDGGGGDDWLEGGAGNDYLRGDAGNDTYYFEAGWGTDTLFNGGAAGDKDIIRFGASVKAQDLSFRRYDGAYGVNYLVISNQATGDSIWVEYYFNGDNTVDSRSEGLGIEFADGTVWDAQTIKQILSQPSTDGNSHIAGGSNKKMLYGEDGSDGFYSGSTNHIETFQAVGCGETLSHANIDALVSAMAAFAPPAAGQSSLTAKQQQALAPLLATS